MQSIWVTTEWRRKRDEVPREVARAQPFVFICAETQSEHTSTNIQENCCMRKRHGGALLAAVCAAASVRVGALAVSRSVLPLKLRGGGGGGVFAFFAKNEPPKRTLTASSKMSAAKA
jgi:hypothetical protein